MNPIIPDIPFAGHFNTIWTEIGAEARAMFNNMNNSIQQLFTNTGKLNNVLKQLQGSFKGKSPVKGNINDVSGGSPYRHEMASKENLDGMFKTINNIIKVFQVPGRDFIKEAVKLIAFPEREHIVPSVFTITGREGSAQSAFTPMMLAAMKTNSEDKKQSQNNTYRDVLKYEEQMQFIKHIEEARYNNLQFQAPDLGIERYSTENASAPINLSANCDIQPQIPVNNLLLYDTGYNARSGIREDVEKYKSINGFSAMHRSEFPGKPVAPTKSAKQLYKQSYAGDSIINPGLVQTETQDHAGKGTLVINLNRPLVENFTIHVGDAKEGVRDFKRQVEEALLEIINNVNAQK